MTASRAHRRSPSLPAFSLVSTARCSFSWLTRVLAPCSIGLTSVPGNARFEFRQDRSLAVHGRWRIRPIGSAGAVPDPPRRRCKSERDRGEVTETYLTYTSRMVIGREAADQRGRIPGRHATVRCRFVAPGESRSGGKPGCAGVQSSAQSVAPLNLPRNRFHQQRSGSDRTLLHRL